MKTAQHRFAGLLASLGCLAWLSACGGTTAAPSGSSGSSALPSSIVDAARSEATVAVYGQGGEPIQAAMVKDFEQANPGIKVAGTFTTTAEQLNQLNAERTAGKYLADVIVGGDLVLKQSGFLPT